VRTPIHELAHAIVAEADEEFAYAYEEVIVESATYIAASAAGLDTSGESIPYVAGWGENGALEAIQQVAELIDRVALRIEEAITPIREGGRAVVLETARQTAAWRMSDRYGDNYAVEMAVISRRRARRIANESAHTLALQSLSSEQQTAIRERGMDVTPEFGHDPASGGHYLKTIMINSEPDAQHLVVRVTIQAIKGPPDSTGRVSLPRSLRWQLPVQASTPHRRGLDADGA
jgi:hypothetical protein